MPKVVNLSEPLFCAKGCCVKLSEGRYQIKLVFIFWKTLGMLAENYDTSKLECGNQIFCGHLNIGFQQKVMNSQ